MEHSPATHAWCAGASAGDLFTRSHGVWGTRRFVFRSRVGNIARSLYFYSIPDPRHYRGSLAHTRSAIFFVVFAPADSVAMGVLGFCRNLCAERADEKPYRTGLPAGRNLSIPVTHRKFEAHPQAEIALEYPRIYYDCSTVAHLGRAPQSKPGGGEGFPLVLFCKRAVPAVCRQAGPSRI